MPRDEAQRISDQLASLIEVTEIFDEVTTTDTFKAALFEGRDRCLKTKAALDQAILTADDEGINASSAMHRYEEALAAAIEELRYVWDRVRDHVVNLSPAELASMGAEELAERRELFDRTPELPSRRSTARGRTAARNKLITLYARLASATEYGPIPELAQLEEKIEAAKLAYTAVTEEPPNEQDAYRSLIAASEAAERDLNALRELLSAILRFEGSPSSVDELLRVRARRSEP